jgi:hypothetical protein
VFYTSFMEYINRWFWIRWIILHSFETGFNRHVLVRVRRKGTVMKGMDVIRIANT